MKVGLDTKVLATPLLQRKGAESTVPLAVADQMVVDYYIGW